LEINVMKLYLVIPCYNEQEVLLETAKRTKEKLLGLMEKGKITKESRICFVDDGSKDKTWEIIDSLCAEDEIYCGLKLSRNKGHQNALLAGLMSVKGLCDAAISLDADLQDDIDAIDAMVDKYIEGCDIVYGVRSSRKTDKLFKRTTARAFYKLMRAMGVETVYDHADYRLMSRRALEALAEFDEVNLFLRGLVPLVGFKSDVVEYERNKRFAGRSKYPFKKMLAFAFEGITSMSIKPIRMISSLGFLIFVASIGMLIYSLIRHFTGNTVEGWTSIVVSVWAVGGLQLLAIGVIGEYIGKIYLETKHRPKYIIDTKLNLGENGDQNGK
jgi:glycosyltransferase involved in cell wall biosynthesis